MELTRILQEHFSKQNIVKNFVGWMVSKSEDFASDYHRYNDAVNVLYRDLGDAVTGEIEAIEQQCASNLIFSGFLGFKANLDHFIDPVAKNFLDVDFEVFLREETARRLPQYEQAQEIRNRFYSRLTSTQKKVYEDIVTYTCQLETVGPKLAHFYGYILGNRILPQVVPGYHVDSVLTVKYHTMLEDYLGEHVLPIT